MAKVRWEIRKETFIPEKNYFITEPVKVEREEFDIEIQLQKNINLTYAYQTVLLILFVLFGLVGGIFFGCVATAYPICWLVCIGLVAGCTAGLFLVIPALDRRADKYAQQLHDYQKEQDVWNSPEIVKEIKAYNEEQKRIAEEWRAAHPLEEKIRACLKDPKSSAEIADLARFYAKEYLLMERNNETLDR